MGRVCKLVASDSSLRRNRRKRLRRTWSYKRFGNFWEKEVPQNSAEFFKENFRCERVFNILVTRLPRLARKDTPFRLAIPLEKRIAVALFTLGSSSEYRSIGISFGISKTMVGSILNEFCREVVRELSNEFLPPNFMTQDKVSECVAGFENLGFPQCFGAMDGCHIEVKPPTKNKVDYHNYRKWYSTVLFALVDYRFIYINVGAPGRVHDSQPYEQSKLKQLVGKSSLFEENSKIISGVSVPVVILGDSAFKFTRNVMKPYPFSVDASPERRVFNYNLSKIRRVVENAFGHLKARFRRIGKGLEEMSPITSRNIMEHVAEKFEIVKTSIINAMKRRLISLKLDIASRHSRGILGVNAQFYEHEAIKIVTLGIIELNKKHTGANLSAEIENILQEFGLMKNQIYSVTSDNGRNIIKSIELMNEEADDSCDDVEYELVHQLNFFDKLMVLQKMTSYHQQLGSSLLQAMRSQMKTMK
ncbi:hypothetical protein ACLKA6_002500 [Drosophila palustris]